MPQLPRFSHLLSVMGLLLLLCSTPTRARQVLVMGDSLSAGFGMAAEQGWVHLLRERLQGQGWNVVNASISGETTAGGAARIASELERHRPAVVIIELGANDALRGLLLDIAGRNLRAMIDASQAIAAKVLLIGMQIPPNYGPDYTAQFQTLFRDLARSESVALLPFLLEPIALDPTAFQPDQLHPTAAAQPQLEHHVWTQLRNLIVASEQAP